jgi:hypothetical protein
MKLIFLDTMSKTHLSTSLQLVLLNFDLKMYFSPLKTFLFTTQNEVSQLSCFAEITIHNDFAKFVIAAWFYANILLSFHVHTQKNIIFFPKIKV